MEALKINEHDNVAVALIRLQSGSRVEIGDQSIVLTENIPQGHKFALQAIQNGEQIVKYGFTIGKALGDIPQGGWVHNHNVKTGLGEILAYEYVPEIKESAPGLQASFMGYPRRDGSAGVRNEVWIVPTVGCVNAIAQKLAACGQDLKRDDIDGVHAFPHPFGCSQLGEDHLNTQKALAGLVNHPNAGAVLVLGLGCENNNIGEFKKILGEYDPERVAFLECQAVEDELAEGRKIIEQLIEFTSRFKREPIDVSKLVIGLKCGGSDGMSGITANPLVGRFSDMLISKGGSTILTEVPEMFGAETILMNRCVNKSVFNSTVSLINGFKNYFTQHNQVIYENPSPGNKEGGISTLEDKSLGCIQKGGSAPVVGVLDYGEKLRVNGLNLLNAPGNDLVASTALAVSGAHIILFTTGRGTPFGSPVPTVKISSNNLLYQKKANWIDFNAGEIADGKSVNELADEFFEYVISVASGKQTNTEINDYRDFTIFKQGVTL